MFVSVTEHCCFLKYLNAREVAVCDQSTYEWPCIIRSALWRVLYVASMLCAEMENTHSEKGENHVSLKIIYSLHSSRPEALSSKQRAPYWL